MTEDEPNRGTDRLLHSAAGDQPTLARTAVAYHYGVFSFDQPNFLGRFILGRMLYSMGRDDAAMIDAYIDNDRDVILQELNLTMLQKKRLRDALEQNWLPNNREYLYE